MTNLIYFPRFIPLSTPPTNPLFYYDSNASLDVLFDAIEARMAALLLEEVRALLQEFNPITLQLRREKE